MKAYNGLRMLKNIVWKHSQQVGLATFLEHVGGTRKRWSSPNLRYYKCVTHLQ